jgi:hypothetical protein
MGKQLERLWLQGQGSRIAAAGPLNYEFAMYIQANCLNKIWLNDMAERS